MNPTWFMALISYDNLTILYVWFFCLTDSKGEVFQNRQRKIIPNIDDKKWTVITAFSTPEVDEG